MTANAPRTTASLKEQLRLVRKKIATLEAQNFSPLERELHGDRFNALATSMLGIWRREEEKLVVRLAELRDDTTVAR